ncbi:MAG: protein kinase [Proteobacteria bacterium]|nr:protein kinase [Pseudomonadota bacterium]
MTSRASTKQPSESIPPRAENDFFGHNKLLRSLPPEAFEPFVERLTRKEVKAGERFIRQGEKGEEFFLIEQGSCVVSVERDGDLHPLAKSRPGDVVGEMAVLTGERRNAHVDAASDMILWGLSRAAFDDLAEQHSDLRSLLTEIMVERFAASKLTRDRHIGKYRIVDVIGQGGWSIVYKGVHHALNIPVAIKMLRHDLAMNPDFIDKFHREAKTIARLNHENIVRVYDIEERYRTVFIMMECLEGVTLQYLLDNSPPPPLARSLDILMQVCAGLAYAHQKGIVHQDVKPANIFLQHNQRVRVVDFGLACPQGTEDLDLPGTVGYMSPEQIEGDPVDERSDIYSLAITAFEMVTGRRPFPEEDVAKLMDLHRTMSLPDPRNLVPDLPEEWARFILRAGQREPEGRYQSIGEVIEELGPLAAKMGVGPGAAPRPRRQMISLYLFFRDEHHLALAGLLDDFSAKAEKLGVKVRAVDVKEV